MSGITLSGDGAEAWIGFGKRALLRLRIQGQKFGLNYLKQVITIDNVVITVEYRVVVGNDFSFINIVKSGIPWRYHSWIYQNYKIVQSPDNSAAIRAYLSPYLSSHIIDLYIIVVSGGTISSAENAELSAALIAAPPGVLAGTPAYAGGAPVPTELLPIAEWYPGGAVYDGTNTAIKGDTVGWTRPGASDYLNVKTTEYARAHNFSNHAGVFIPPSQWFIGYLRARAISPREHIIFTPKNDFWDGHPLNADPTTLFLGNYLRNSAVAASTVDTPTPVLSGVAVNVDVIDRVVASANDALVYPFFYRGPLVDVNGDFVYFGAVIYFQTGVANVAYGIYVVRVTPSLVITTAFIQTQLQSAGEFPAFTTYAGAGGSLGGRECVVNFGAEFYLGLHGVFLSTHFVASTNFESCIKIISTAGVLRQVNSIYYLERNAFDGVGSPKWFGPRLACYRRSPDSSKDLIVVSDCTTNVAADTGTTYVLKPGYTRPIQVRYLLNGVESLVTVAAGSIPYPGFGEIGESCWGPTSARGIASVNDNGDYAICGTYLWYDSISTDTMFVNRYSIFNGTLVELSYLQAVAHNTNLITALETQRLLFPAIAATAADGFQFTLRQGTPSEPNPAPGWHWTFADKGVVLFQKDTVNNPGVPIDAGVEPALTLLSDVTSVDGVRTRVYQLILTSVDAYYFSLIRVVQTAGIIDTVASGQDITTLDSFATGTPTIFCGSKNLEYGSVIYPPQGFPRL